MSWVKAIGEAFLAVPFIGGIVVLSTSYSILGVMFILHAVTLILAIRDHSAKSGSILGLATSIFAWIPFVGWFLHLVTAVVLAVQAVISRPKYY